MKHRATFEEQLGQPIRHRARRNRDWTNGEAALFVMSLTALATAIAAAQVQLMTVIL